MDMAKDWTSSLINVSSVLPHSTPLVPLRPNLWFDPNSRSLRRNRKHIVLTPREAQILIVLLQAPGRYIAAALLADWLSPPKGGPVYEHSIEQTICGLRRKLGESGRRPRILQSQRGSGYRLLPLKMERAEVRR
jgi:DNA-binding response OmpR family regulator